MDKEKKKNYGMRTPYIARIKLCANAKFRKFEMIYDDKNECLSNLFNELVSSGFDGWYTM